MSGRGGCGQAAQGHPSFSEQVKEAANITGPTRDAFDAAGASTWEAQPSAPIVFDPSQLQGPTVVRRRNDWPVIHGWAGN